MRPVEIAAKDDTSSDEIRQVAYKWHVLLGSDDATDADRRDFEAWLDADPRHLHAYDRSVTVWAALGKLRPEQLDDASIRPSGRERVFAFTERALSFINTPRVRLVTATAAVLAVGMFVFALLQTEPAPISDEPIVSRYASEIGEIRLIGLDDGTRVTLGAATQIEARLSADTRQVTLTSGAALFEVAPDPDRPFSVEAGYLTATAIGTRFDVRHNGGVARVGVADGVVRVSFPFLISGHPSGRVSTEELHAGQQVAATVDDGLRKVQSDAASAIGAWRDKRLVYEAGTLREIVADANRYSSRTIRIDADAKSIAGLEVTVSYDGDDIDGMLATLPDIFPVAVEQTDSQTVLIRALEAAPP